MPTSVVQTRNRFERTGHGRPLLCRFDVLVAVVVDGAVAVEDDEFGDHVCCLKLPSTPNRRLGSSPHATA